MPARVCGGRPARRCLREELLPAARHIEVQLLGDGAEVVHLHERDCSVQRRRQKQVETCPARNLPSSLRERLFSDALAIGSAVGYRSAGTVEFLVDQHGF